MPEPLISVERVSKRFCRNLRKSLWYGVSDICRDLVGVSAPANLRSGEFWAVKDLNFEIRSGESVALVGRNGAGKSTLLKMLNGLFYPDEGQITVRGRVAGLIELGAGFNPVLSGRENVYVNAAVLGMSKRQVDREFEAIVDFAELSEFIDMPLKSYSSGMKVRLGFAVATQLQPDVLLIDEVLAVGDAAFRAKCYRRLSDIMERGTAFILVSHSHHTLLSICQRGLLLSGGSLVAEGHVRAVLDRYDADVAKEVALQPTPIKSGQSVEAICRVLGTYFRDESGKRQTSPRTGHAVDFCVLVDAPQPFADVSLDVVVHEGGTSGAPILAITSGQDKQRQELPKGQSEYRLTLDPLGLPPGHYVLKLSLNQKPMRTLALVEGIRIDVERGLNCGDSRYYNRRNWQVVEIAPPEALEASGIIDGRS